MVIPTLISSDFGSGQTIDPKVAHKAALRVAQEAQSPEDALLLLDMLGIIPPQEEIIILKKDRLTPQRKEARKRALEDKKRRDLARMREMNIQPYEIGE